MKSLTIGRFPPLGYAGGEAVNTLCTNLSFCGENVKKIMITSCHAAEGKSFLSMNIMRTMAKYGKTVALVDADMRRSVIASRYGIKFESEDKRQGLAHFLAGMASEQDVVYSTDVDGAWMVPAGRAVSNPLPLLNSARFSDLLDYLADSLDYVIVDAPPLGVVIDGAEIAKSCDGTLIVVNYNTVPRQQLIEVKAQLEQTNCPILGTVLNQVEFDNYLSRKYYYKSYYSDYGYYGKSSDKERGGQKKRSRPPKK